MGKQICLCLVGNQQTKPQGHGEKSGNLGQVKLSPEVSHGVRWAQVPQGYLAHDLEFISTAIDCQAVTERTQRMSVLGRS